MTDIGAVDAEDFPSPQPSPVGPGEGVLTSGLIDNNSHVARQRAPFPARRQSGWGEGKRQTSTTFDVAAYANRIGFEGELIPTSETLRELHLAHLRTVPFENLDIHLGRPIVLDEELLFDKVVRHRRGGFCFELNGLFAAFLRAVGFQVTLLGAQFPLPPGQSGPELDHLVLHVQSEDTAKPVLVDIAAGRGSFALPLQSGTRRVQAQAEAGASFRLIPENGGCRVWRREPDGDWARYYLFAWRPRQLLDFTEGCLYHQASPDSHFTQARICTRLTQDGRVTLSERRLITTSDGIRSEQELPNDAAYQQALWDHFGINLDA
jgi:N-hydroxyarylamine O-acetyltransferase